MPRIELRATDGTRLEGRSDAPDEPHGGVAVVCHPHPGFGGSMDSWMVPVLARAVRAEGWHTVRFNFRGVGASEGERDDGEAEVLDLAGAVEHGLGAVAGEGPVIVGGWSFGAHVALRYALDDDRVVGWFGVGLPLDPAAAGDVAVDPEVLAGWDAAKLFIHGDHDEVSDLTAVNELFEEAAEPKHLRVVEGGDHFLAEHGDVLITELRAFAARLAPEPGVRWGTDTGAGPDPEPNG